jgi:hypothetical protein
VEKRKKTEQKFFCSRVYFSEVRRDEWRLTGDKSLFILKKKMLPLQFEVTNSNSYFFFHPLPFYAILSPSNSGAQFKRSFKKTKLKLGFTQIFFWEDA